MLRQAVVRQAPQLQAAPPRRSTRAPDPRPRGVAASSRRRSSLPHARQWGAEHSYASCVVRAHTVVSVAAQVDTIKLLVSGRRALAPAALGACLLLRLLLSTPAHAFAPTPRITSVRSTTTAKVCLVREWSAGVQPRSPCFGERASERAYQNVACSAEVHLRLSAVPQPRVGAMRDLPAGVLVMSMLRKSAAVLPCRTRPARARRRRARTAPRLTPCPSLEHRRTPRGVRVGRRGLSKASAPALGVRISTYYIYMLWCVFTYYTYYFAHCMYTLWWSRLSLHIHTHIQGVELQRPRSALLRQLQRFPWAACRARRKGQLHHPGS